MALLSTGLFLCIENNRLATEAILLIESLRRFGGSLANAPVYTFNPRGRGGLEAAVLDRLRGLGVVHSEERLNDRFSDYALANKIFVAAHMERHASEEILVCLDSDCVILREPNEFLLEGGYTVAATPVWDIGIGAEGPTDPASAFWMRAAMVCNFSKPLPEVETVLSRKQVWLYLNSGLVVVRRTAGIFEEWRRCFEAMFSDGAIQRLLRFHSADQVGYGPAFFLEQAALTFAVAPHFENLSVLNPRYNCPLHHRAALQAAYPGERFELEDVVQFHYNRIFHMVGALSAIRPQLAPQSEEYQWLDVRLPLQPVQRNVNQALLLRAFEHDMRRWRSWLIQKGIASGRQHAAGGKP